MANYIDLLKDSIKDFFQKWPGADDLISQIDKANLLDLKFIVLNTLNRTYNEELIITTIITAYLNEVNKLLESDPDDLKNMIDLSEEINKLKEENDRLKKALAIFTVSSK